MNSRERHSGHRSLDGLRKYERVSANQQKDALSLFGKSGEPSDLSFTCNYKTMNPMKCLVALLKVLTLVVALSRSCCQECRTKLNLENNKFDTYV